MRLAFIIKMAPEEDFSHVLKSAGARKVSETLPRQVAFQTAFFGASRDSARLCIPEDLLIADRRDCCETSKALVPQDDIIVRTSIECAI